MKKVLSVLLAVTMILAMLPTTFAAVDAETGAVTYDFYHKSPTHSEIVVDKGSFVLESIGGEKALTEYGNNTGRDWAYLGSNVWGGEAGSGTGAFVDIYTSLRVPAAQSTDTKRWVAFKIRVPESAEYKVTGTAVMNKNSTTAMDIYIAPLTGNIAQTFSDTSIYGTVDDNMKRTDAKDFTALNIDSAYKIGRVNTRIADTSATNYNVVQDFLVTQKGTEAGTELLNVTLDKDTEYVLVFTDAASTQRRLTPASIKLTVDKTHEYVFNRSVLTGDILENTAFTQNYRVFYAPEGETLATASRLDTYNHINSSESNLWAISPLSGRVNDSTKRFYSALGTEYLQMVGRKDLNQTVNADARFILKLKADYPGIYEITADVVEHAMGTKADVYLIPASEEITEISLETLKNHNSIGSVSNISGHTDSKIGEVEIQSAGDYYMVFAFNSQNPKMSENRQYFNLSKLTFTEIDSLPETGVIPEDVEAEDVPKLSFSATTNIPDDAKVTINETEGNLQVLAPSRGDKISIKAPEIEGYRFIGWKSGTAEKNGEEVKELANTAKFVKDLKQTDTFTVYTSTFLTAVYEKTEPAESTASIVEFWNLDGSYLGQKTVDKINEEGGLPTTSLIGHTFTGWLTKKDTALVIDEIVDKITHAVASYTENETLLAANKDAVRVNGVSQSEVKYGTEVECVDPEPSKVTHWLRDGKVVSYDPTYKYYVWDSTNISSSYAPITKNPLVVLDDDTVSDAYMIEYDGAGKTIVEVGILFGNGTPTVGSKSEIFKSQRGDNHGQFAAKPSDSNYTARGYMIYEDTDGSYKVIYSE